MKRPRRTYNKASWRFQALIRLTDTMSEERLMHLCFEASDEEFDKAIEELGGHVARYKENPNLVGNRGIKMCKSIVNECPYSFKGIWRKKEEDTNGS